MRGGSGKKMAAAQASQPKSRPKAMPEAGGPKRKGSGGKVMANADLRGGAKFLKGMHK